MATMVVETGAGLPTANSYCSLIDADTYHEMRLHNTTWTSLSSDTQEEIALMWATRILDEEVNWAGVKYTEDQGLRWPRSGVVDPDGYSIDTSEMPTFLIEATAELAMHLITEDRSSDSGTMGFSKIAAGSVKLEIDKRWQKGILPRSVWNMVKRYGTKTGGKKLLVRV